jgi:hypothetical protein
MKLFIKNYNPINILKKQKILDEFYFSKKNNIEIISDDGIFYIDNKFFSKMNVISDKLVELRIADLELLLDKSIYNNEIVHQLPLNHIDNHITTFYYAINSKSKIKLVIEGKYDTNELIDNNKINKYINFTPNNFYFEIPNEITDFELLNNDDLNVFLSLLN